MKKPFLYLKKMDDVLHSIVRELDPGTYHIKYVLAGHETIEFDITVIAGKPTTFHRTLIPVAPTPEGRTDLEKSEIPTTIYLETKAPFSIYTENTGKITAKYRVHLKFVGVVKTYEFISPWIDKIKPGESAKIAVDAIIPSDAIPEGQMSASFDISTTVEAV
jgi:uncharacterized membrane protein